MKLRDLNAEFLKHVPAAQSPDGHEHHGFVDSLSEADGIWFLCPKCAAGCASTESEDGRRVFPGVHHVLCWFVGRVPDDLSPGPGRWTPSGTGLDDLTFIPGDPPRMCSVHLSGSGGCGWHGHVTNGEAD